VSVLVLVLLELLGLRLGCLTAFTYLCQGTPETLKELPLALLVSFFFWIFLLLFALVVYLLCHLLGGLIGRHEILHLKLTGSFSYFPTFDGVSEIFREGNAMYLTEQYCV
jgi:hypothetical protein